MAKNQHRRLPVKQMQKDAGAYSALHIVAGYNPVNPAYSMANGESIHQSMTAARTAASQAEAAFKSARDDAALAEWAFHNFMLGVKDQVAAQFGHDSNELQTLGLKKKSDYKRPSSGKRNK